MSWKSENLFCFLVQLRNDTHKATSHPLTMYYTFKLVTFYLGRLAFSSICVAGGPSRASLVLTNFANCIAAEATHFFVS